MSSGSHVKFDDSDAAATSELESKPMPLTKESNGKRDARIDTSDSESDDDAPEEEGLGSSKQEIEQQQEERRKQAREEQRLLKEKRRKQDAVFREQQEAKRKLEQAQEQEQEDDEEEAEDEDVVEELPEDFLQNIDDNKNSNSSSTGLEAIPTHINFNDVDASQYIPEIKAQLQKKKKKTLKGLRKTTANKGPVSVRVIGDNFGSRTLAPKKEVQVTSTKDRWLKRRSLRRK